MQRTAALVYCVFFSSSSSRERSISMPSIFFGRWPCLDPSAPWTRHSSLSPFCHFFCAQQPHALPTKKEFKRKHIYNITSQSITLVCPVANCLRKGSIILFLDPLYIFCHTSNCTCSFSFPFLFSFLLSISFHVLSLSIRNTRKRARRTTPTFFYG